VQRSPTSLATNRYAHQADAFRCAVQGYLCMPRSDFTPRAGGRPFFAGILEGRHR
jgi:hypothetical protein